MPDFSTEQHLLSQGAKHIAGVDEVGRGPWAGPVVAAAVVLDAGCLPPGANDSKKLTARKRELLYDVIYANAQVGVGQASVMEIDSMNILAASELAMCRAVDNLPQQPCHVLVDGNRIPRGLQLPATAIVKGDGKSLSIACASIVAKVVRDKLMCQLSEAFPHYGWERNAGYGTRQHQEGLAQFGVSDHHRRSFGPIRTLVAQQTQLAG